MTIRPRRSVLYMPANNGRAVEKAKTLDADGIVLDLEDSIAPDAKAAARDAAAAAVRAGGFGAREVCVRVNGLDTPWAEEDFAVAVAAAPDAIVVPKVSGPETLARLGARMRELDAAPHIRIWAMIETPVGVLRAHDIAAMAENAETRLAGLIVGTNDLVKEAMGRVVKGRAPLVPWLMQVLAAARACGIGILDGVYNDFRDQEGFAAECTQGRDMGFDGKTLIHPGQIAPCNAAFTPDTAEIAQARRIIAAFEMPENVGKGVVQIDGAMVERLHAEIARRIVTIADVIAARGA